MNRPFIPSAGKRPSGALLALLAALCLSCVRESPPPAEDSLSDAAESIELSFGDATRSVLGDGESLDSFESVCRDVTLFQYIVSGTGVRLESARYQRLDGASGIVTKGMKGVKYRFYALLNCGDMSSAVKTGSPDTDLADVTVSWAAADRSLQGGVPAAAGPVEVTAGVTARARLLFTRLASRWDIRLECDLPHGGTFTPTSLRIRQSPRVTAPFRGVNAFREGDEASLEDGDCASQDDLLRLSQGDSVRFYTLENACGELIDNPDADPWLKVPSQGTGVAGFLPTYLELTGVYRDATGSLECTNTYRMYLGKDTSRDFTVSRGEQRRLLVSVTEAPATQGYAHAASWKMETQVSDRRTFCFFPSSLPVDSPEERTVGVNTERYDISYYLRGEDAFLERVSFDPSSRTLRALPGRRSCSGTLVARYADDGRTADSLSITLAAFSSQVTETPLALSASAWFTEPESHTVHDPACPATHSRVHRTDCTVNHTDPSRPDYVDIRDCPNYRSTAGECKFTSWSEPDYGRGRAGLYVSVKGNFRVEGGELRSDVLVPGRDYTVTDAYLCSADGTARHRGEITLKKIDSTRLSVVLSDMDNAPGCFWWHIHIRTASGLARHFVYGGANAGDDMGKTFPFPAREAEASMSSGTVSCSVGSRRLWAVYDRSVLSITNADSVSGETFTDGDRAEIKALSASGTQRVYLLDRSGIVTGENAIDTGKK